MSEAETKYYGWLRICTIIRSRVVELRKLDNPNYDYNEYHNMAECYDAALRQFRNHWL